MKYDIYYSSDFQCPISGIPVILLYDEEFGAITAEICTFVYPLDPEENEFYNEDCVRETEDWCKHFYKHAEDIDEANEIAEKYDCWF